MRNTVLIIIAIFCLVSCKKKHYNIFSAGSYAYAESYTIDLSEQETINRVNKLKKKNSNMMPPTMWDGTEYNMEDERHNHWYFVHAYIKDEQRTIVFYIRGDWKPTTIALISATEKGKLRSWKFINKDFDDDENEHIIKWFEENILKELEKEGVKIKRETFWGTESL